MDQTECLRFFAMHTEFLEEVVGFANTLTRMIEPIFLAFEAGKGQPIIGDTASILPALRQRPAFVQDRPRRDKVIVGSRQIAEVIQPISLLVKS
jgi:hypothetical protein